MLVQQDMGESSEMKLPIDFPGQSRSTSLFRTGWGKTRCIHKMPSQSSIWRRCHNRVRMLKKARLLTRHPGAPRRTLSAGKTAVSEEARRTLRYVEPLSDTSTPLEDFFSILIRGSCALLLRSLVREHSRASRAYVHSWIG